MERLQEIGRSGVVNLTVFGRAFRTFCASEAMLVHMPDHGFMDGGCLSLAVAIGGWLGADGAKVRYVATGDRIEHAVSEIVIDGASYHLDCDGLATSADMTAKMARLEFRPGTRIVDAEDAAVAAAGLVDDGRSAALAAALALRFGNEAPTSDWLATSVRPRHPAATA